MDAASALKLFNEKAKKLEGLSFTKMLAEQKTGVTLSGKQGHPLTIERSGPGDEAIDAFVLTLRFFVQDNESISLRNFAHLYAGLPVDQELIDNFNAARDALNSFLDNKPLVVVLDEIDKAQPKDQSSILYTLSELENAGVVCISNSRATLLSLDDRVKSRLNSVFIGFDPYNNDELRRILEARAGHALFPGCFVPEILDRIAGLSGGDARVAIQTLRQAAQLAEVQGTRTIAADHIEHGVVTVRTLRTQYALNKLTEHHRILFTIVSSAREITNIALWVAYIEKCKETSKTPIADRTFRAYLNTLVSQGLVLRERLAEPGALFRFRPCA
ncbi:MAG: hypothetical protein HY051_02965 [Candidatus Aenigmarchaeota archaeon]|nr:hypothetical protein [Candidatus Aenigmarchaeota archaeon]